VGLEIGADDYVTKPFSLRELVARIRALLRRREMKEQSVRSCSTAAADRRAAHKVTLGNRSVLLSALEFRLLHFLASHAGIVFSRDQLLDRVWGSDRNVTPRSVDVYIRRLREKMEEHGGGPEWVQTVHGVATDLQAAKPEGADGRSGMLAAAFLDLTDGRESHVASADTAVIRLFFLLQSGSGLRIRSRGAVAEDDGQLPDADPVAREIKAIEHACDKVTHEALDQLNKVFITRWTERTSSC